MSLWAKFLTVQILHPPIEHRLNMSFCAWLELMNKATMLTLFPGLNTVCDEIFSSLKTGLNL